MLSIIICQFPKLRKKKAQGEALKNTAAFLASYGGAAAYAIHKIK